MEFLDEESRPRFLFQSRASSSPISEPETLKVNKTLAFICISISSLLIILSIFFLQSETLKFLLLWFSLSLIVGPFAPVSITGGDIRVGQGELLETLDQDQAVDNDEYSKKRVSNRKQKTRKPEDLTVNSNSTVSMNGVVNNSEKSKVKSVNSNGSVIHEEREWIEEDFELLKKQILKHPVGETKRWELITEAFQGRHGLESVIKMGKSLSERKPGNGDAFSQFLKQRKPLDKRIIEDVNGESDLVDNNEIKKESSTWSSGEDIALLNALKAFPKDVSMRWEKIAAAVPGKTKACCMKRVTELKKDFRSTKAAGDL
ncbi:SANT/Myb domain [Macleaya cordata]|uniref:SANT/Myb domain n=1 Tax=Macleaya cordata TaxID=56857 RepID=A0A200PWA0_MACCD|nr:SANT/Myb domain [Macleaya cordata]